LTPMLDFTPASSLPLRGSEIARSRLASREEAWQVPVVYLHCNDLRSEHRCTQKIVRRTTGSRLGLHSRGSESSSARIVAERTRSTNSYRSESRKLYPGWSKVPVRQVAPHEQQL